MSYRLNSGRLAACLLGFCLSIVSAGVLAEGSRSLYPVDYPTNGARANLDIQPGNRYLDRIVRRGFTYVYAEAGEYITLGSSNRATGGDILVYNPQDFGIPGDETVPALADFSCATGAAVAGPGVHYSGGTLGRISSRLQELAGPNSADNSAGVTDGFAPCAYQVPVTGIYGVVFGTGSSGNPDGKISSVTRSNNSVAAWDVTVRRDDTALTDLEGRAFTYAFLGYTAGNSRPVFSTLYYITSDGYRYQQDLRGLDPNGYALFANTFGFLDNGEPLYKSLRGQDWKLENLPDGITTQTSEFPIFFSNVSPSGANEAEVNKVLTALSIPLVPPSPQMSNVSFSGVLGGNLTSTGVGGTFAFDTTDTVSYEIVISRNGLDFDPAEPQNRMLTGIAYSGVHQVTWDGLDNNRQPFPASATAYRYRAKGRNGEVHFPIIDAENNGSPTVTGGGPTITRLNGVAPDDTTVFFDDRGYVTHGGEAVGILNGTLCDNPTPAAATVPVRLDGVDSSTVYRDWQFGGNSNSDCASSAGWGDAKAVNLWTYFLTGERNAELEIKESIIDVGTEVAVQSSAVTGDTVLGTFSFGNYGSNTAEGVSYFMKLPSGLDAVSFPGFPGGAAPSYSKLNGTELVFTTFPDELTPGQVIAGLQFSYRAPASGPIVVTTRIETSSTEAADLLANNNDQATTGIGTVEVATGVSSFPSEAIGGVTATGVIAFSNLGSQDAQGVTYAVTIGQAGEVSVASVTSGLPSGASATYDPATGVMSLINMPTTLVHSRIISLGISFTVPNLGDQNIRVASHITTTSSDGIAANNDAFVDIYLPAIVDLSTEVNVPAGVFAGDLVQGTLSFANISADDAVDVIYSMSLTLGLGSVNFDSLPAGAAASYNNGTGVVTFTNFPATLVSGASIANIGFSYTMPATGPVLVSSAIATSSNDIVVPNNTAAGSTAVVPRAVVDLATTVFVPSGTFVGDPVQGTFSFQNFGPEEALDVTFGLTLSPGLGTVGFSNLPAGGNAVYNNGSGLVTLSGFPASLTAGQSIDAISFSYTMPGVGPIVANTDIGTSSNDTVLPNNSATDSTVATPRAVVDLLSTVLVPVDAFIGNPVEGIFSFENIGPQEALDVSYALTLSPGLGAVVFSNLPAGSAALYNDGSGLVTFTGFPASLTSGQFIANMGFSYTMPGTGPIVANTDIGTSSNDTVLPNNSATDSTVATPRAVVDLGTTVSVPAGALAEDPVQGTFSFANHGIESALDVTYTMTLSPGLAAVAFTNLPAGGTALYNAATGTVTFTGLPASLTAGETVDGMGFSYTMPDTGPVVVTTSIATSSTDTVAANNNASGSTTVDLPKSIVINAQAICVMDAPYVEYEVTAENFTPTNLATVEWLAPDGTVVATLTDQPLTTTRLLWPEAAVDNTGRGSAWPGWELVDGRWLEIPSQVRPQVTVRISVNPTAEVTLSYPPATPACNTSPPAAQEVDLGTTVTVVPSGPAGEAVTGTFSFANLGPGEASNVTYSLELSPGLGAVLFSNLPTGAAASYDNATGVVSFTGFPSSLASGQQFDAIGFSFTMPETGTVTVATAIGTSSDDLVPANNADSGSTRPGSLVGAVATTTPEPVPVLPLPLLVLLTLLIAGTGLSAKRANRKRS